VLLSIVAKEVRECVLSLRFALAFALCLPLLVGSSAVLIGEYGAKRQAYESATSFHREQITSYPSGQMVYLLGHSVDKPPASLGALVEGADAYVGSIAFTSVLSGLEVYGTSAEHDVAGSLFGRIDPAGVIMVVLSLVALLLSYDAVAGEREGGTLKLCLSNAVPRDVLIAGKYLGRLMVVLAPFCVSFVIAALLMVLSPNIEMGGADLLRLLLVLVLSVLYISAFVLLGLLVSTRTRQASSSLMILLLVWVVLLFGVPRAAWAVASFVRDVPSKQKMFQEQMAALMEVIEEQRKQGAPEGDPESAEERMINDILGRRQKVADYHRRKVVARNDLARQVSLVSPSAAFLQASMALAETDMGRHWRFIDAARAYDPEFLTYIHRVVSEGTVDRFSMDGGGDWPLDEMPVFILPQRGLGESLAGAKFELASLGIWNVLLFLGTWVSFLRAEVA